MPGGVSWRTAAPPSGPGRVVHLVLVLVLKVLLDPEIQLSREKDRPVKAVNWSRVQPGPQPRDRSSL